MSIRVSQKHGVNPTIPLCFWCGEPKNEIALLGRLPGDKEAPMNCVIDYNPCDKCEANFKQGVLIMRASNRPPQEHMPPIQGDPRRGNAVYVDGAHVVMKREAFERVFSQTLPKEMVDAGLEHGKCFLEDVAFNNMFLNPPKVEEFNTSNPSYEALAKYLDEADGVELECVEDGDLSCVRNKIDGKALLSMASDKDNLSNLVKHVGHEIEVTEDADCIWIECATCQSTLHQAYREGEGAANA